jgi:hypothetical protein
LKEGEIMYRKTTQRNFPSSRATSSKGKDRTRRQQQQIKRKESPLAHIARKIGMMMSTVGSYI